MIIKIKLIDHTVLFSYFATTVDKWAWDIVSEWDRNGRSKVKKEKPLRKDEGPQFRSANTRNPPLEDEEEKGPGETEI